MAWSIVQRNKPATATASATSITKANAFGSNVSTANRLVIIVGVNYNPGTTGKTFTVAITDGQGNTWTQIGSTASAPNNSNTQEHLFVYTTVPGSSGALTPSVKATGTATGSWEMGWVGAEISGLDMSAGTGCLRTSSVGTGSSGTGATTSVNCGTTGTDTAGDLVIGASSDWGGTIVYSISTTGFTKDAGLTINSDGNQDLTVATKTATGSTNAPTFTYTSSSVQNIGNCTVIALASSGTTVTPDGVINVPVAANQSTPAITMAAGNPAVTVAAPSPTLPATIFGGNPAVTVAAPSPSTASTITTNAANVSVGVPQATVTITTPAGLSNVTIAANNGTASTGTLLSGGLSNVSVAALNGSIATVFTGGVSAVTVAAPSPTLPVSPTGGVASVAVGALNATVVITTTGGVSNVSTAALGASPAISLAPGNPAVAVAALNGTVVTPGNVTITPTVAVVAVAALQPVVEIDVTETNPAIVIVGVGIPAQPAPVSVQAHDATVVIENGSSRPLPNSAGPQPFPRKYRTGHVPKLVHRFYPDDANGEAHPRRP